MLKVTIDQLMAMPLGTIFSHLHGGDLPEDWEPGALYVLRVVLPDRTGVFYSSACLPHEPWSRQPCVGAELVVLEAADLVALITAAQDALRLATPTP